MSQTIDYSKIYSPSRLGMFDVCPKQYHFYYLDPIYSRMKNELKKQPQNIWSFHTLGKAVHNAITLLYHSPPDQRAKERLKEYLKETWRSEVMPQKEPPLGKWGGFESLDEERAIYRQALLMLRNFFRMAVIEPEIEYLPTHDFRRSIEDYQNLIIPLSEDFDISGRFDLVIKGDNNWLEIIDFKTGKKESNDHFQLRFYRVLAEANFQKPVKKASFYFLKTGQKKEFDLGKEKVGDGKEEILARIHQIEKTDSFKPEPSKLCQFCLFKSFCPEKNRVNGMIKADQQEDYPDTLPF